MAIPKDQNRIPQREDVDLFIVDLADLAQSHQDRRYMKTGRILKAAADGTSLRELVTAQELPDSIAMLQHEKRLYWTNMGVLGEQDGSVWSCSTDGKDHRIILHAGVLNTPKKIIMDHVGNQMYVCDREGMRIVRCSFDGLDLEDLVVTGDMNDSSHRRDQTRWCVGVALHHEARHMYWTQKGPNKGNLGRIFRAGMQLPRGASPASRNDIECVLSGLPEPIDLDIATVSGIDYLYWTDRGDLPYGNSLNRCALHLLTGEGHDLPLKSRGFSPPPWEVLAQNLHEAMGVRVDVLGERVFVTDLGGCVYCFGLDGSGKRKMYEDRGCFTGIALGQSDG